MTQDTNDQSARQGALSALDADTRRSIADALWQRELDPSGIPPEALEALTGPTHSPEAFGSRMRT
ncbi:MAG: hypothetical protein QG597_295, partial [Actinomycetota bacterium]|nr:hypothetical protein [Actinomycetota bacterium]